MRPGPHKPFGTTENRKRSPHDRDQWPIMQTLLIFLKAPVPGRVKTRLAKDLGEAAAAAAYIDMARSIASQVRDLEKARSVSIRYVYVADPAFADLSWLGEAQRDFWPQGEGDLGARLKRAFDRAFAEGAGRVCVIGMDSPGLTADDYGAAFDRLLERDAVIGPTEDGGYYLIGMSKPAPELFDGISWSSPQVCAQTRRDAQVGGLSIVELPEYFDIDTLAEYERWKKGPSSRPDGL